MDSDGKVFLGFIICGVIFFSIMIIAASCEGMYKADLKSQEKILTLEKEILQLKISNNIKDSTVGVELK